ncbi:TonB-linked outer membrane protein%2C SusC/RagA family [Mycobacterium tuberculosis]|nr:TonB-linked outer membrane protein%2C SusC/RagA family [Mycobacterium tuberculosis]
MDALSGKVAGLNLMRSNAGPVGTTKIILRGENNITGENEALIIVDGVMVNGGSGRRSALDSDNAYGVSSENMPVDYGSGMDDINPEDIGPLPCLKGRVLLLYMDSAQQMVQSSLLLNLALKKIKG